MPLFYSVNSIYLNTKMQSIAALIALSEMDCLNPIPAIGITGSELAIICRVRHVRN